VREQPPYSGEHTDALLAGIGYTSEAIAGLRAGRVVG